MAVRSRAISVGAVTAVALESMLKEVQRVETLIQNLGAVDIYVGGSDVSTSNGIKIAAGASLGLNSVTASAKLYAVAASSTADVRVLEMS